VKVTDLVNSVLKSHQSHLRSKAIQLEKRFESEELVPANPEDIKNAFSNLIVNVVDVVSKGEKVRVQVRNSHDWQGSEREGVRMTVTTGGRIPKEKLEELFEPFFTPKTEAGTGLGLWVAMDLVRRHGGSLQVRRSARRGQLGSCFSVFVPKEEVLADTVPALGAVGVDDSAAARALGNHGSFRRSLGVVEEARTEKTVRGIRSKLSAAARKKIAAAQRERWAKLKQQTLKKGT